MSICLALCLTYLEYTTSSVLISVITSLTVVEPTSIPTLISPLSDNLFFTSSSIFIALPLYILIYLYIYHLHFVKCSNNILHILNYVICSCILKLIFFSKSISDTDRLYSAVLSSKNIIFSVTNHN